jgi:hypothetical protein
VHIPDDKREAVYMAGGAAVGLVLCVGVSIAAAVPASRPLMTVAGEMLILLAECLLALILFRLARSEMRDGGAWTGLAVPLAFFAAIISCMGTAISMLVIGMSAWLLVPLAAPFAAIAAAALAARHGVRPATGDTAA